MTLVSGTLCAVSADSLYMLAPFCLDRKQRIPGGGGNYSFVKRNNQTLEMELATTKKKVS